MPKNIPWITELDFAYSLCEQDGIEPSDDADALMYLAQTTLRQWAWTVTPDVEAPTLTNDMVANVLANVHLILGGYVQDVK